MAQRHDEHKTNPVDSQYPFTGIIKCGNCGKNFMRKSRRGRGMWQCYNYLYFGKSTCFAKQIPEDVLYDISTDVLGLTEFSYDIFKKRIQEIQVPAPNALVFLFYTGEKVQREWQNRSRSASWMDEMRAVASIKGSQRTVLPSIQWAFIRHHHKTWRKA